MGNGWTVGWTLEDWLLSKEWVMKVVSGLCSFQKYTRITINS